MYYVVGISVVSMLIYGLLYSFYLKPICEKTAGEKLHYAGVIAVCVGALAVRIGCGALFYGHQTDMGCFSAWSDMVYSGGFGKFYLSDSFTDYPPGYMYILYVVGFLRSIMDGGALLVKLPAILVDIILGVFVYLTASKRYSQKTALLLSAFLQFSPVLILNSSLWGQVDIIYTSLLAVFIWLVTKKMLIPSYFVFALAFFVKPQALIYTPILILAIVEYILKDFDIKTFFKHLSAGVGAIALVLLLSIPFGIEETIKQYVITLSSYKYATVNAFNLYGAFGMNWQPLSQALSVIGAMFILVIVAFVLIQYLRGNKNWFLLAGILSFATYMLCTKMHERYAFPAVVFFLMAFVIKPQRLSMRMFILATFSQLLNSAWVLFVYETDINHYAFSPFVIVFSVVNILIFGYMIFACIKSLNAPVLSIDAQNKAMPFVFKTRKPKRLTRIDCILMVLLTLVYSLVSFYDLGDKSAPQSWYDLAEASVDVTFDESAYIDKIAIYPSCNDVNEDRSIIVSYTDEFGVGDAEVLDDLDVFAWNFVPFEKSVTDITFSTDHERLMIMEIGILGDDGIIDVKSDNKLFDEQNLVPLRRTSDNSAYFDEIYHARTGYEFVHGFNVYEWTHPPLGKAFIAAGIKLFGMNPFGWRVVGNIFGILMVPLMYIMAKKLFSKTYIAFFTTVIFAFDFMHFVQTRISTIDVYVTFFIMLMYLFMYKYYQTSFYDTPLKKTFVPLLLTGIAFGLGAASKWTAIYACAGIALIFFMKMMQMYDDNYRSSIPMGFTSRFIKTCIFCCLAFLVIPIVLYAVSYIPYLFTENAEGIKTIIDNQKDIFIYHSRTVLDSEHPFASKWYTWPIMLRPIWYYSGTVSETVKEGISAFGNPLVWWAGIPAVLYNVYLAAVKHDRKAVYLIIGYLACLLPWIPVERTTYIYHYFPCVPFVVLMIGHCFEHIHYKRVKVAKWTYGVYAICVIGLFVLFYPVLSGQAIDVGFAEDFLKWFETWILIWDSSNPTLLYRTKKHPCRMLFLLRVEQIVC